MLVEEGELVGGLAGGFGVRGFGLSEGGRGGLLGELGLLPGGAGVRWPGILDGDPG